VGIDLVGFPGELVNQLTVENIKSLERANIEVFLLPFSSWYINPRLTKKALKDFLGNG